MSFNNFEKHQYIKTATYTIQADHRGNTIGIRVKRGMRTTEYQRCNRSANEIFDLPNGDLHGWFNSTQDFVKIMKNKRILDLGCGDGRCVEDLKKYNLNVLGLDLHIENFKSHLIQGDAFNQPFQNGSFDTIFSVWSVFNYEPIIQIGIILKECMRVLSSGGSLLLSPIQDEEKIHYIKKWCERNNVNVFQAFPSNALHLVKK